jgi:hypothetical protein
MLATVFVPQDDGLIKKVFHLTVNAKHVLLEHIATLDQVKHNHLRVRNALEEDTATRAKVKILQTCAKLVLKGGTPEILQQQQLAMNVHLVTIRIRPGILSANPVEEGITHTQQIELNVLDVPLAKT